MLNSKNELIKLGLESNMYVEVIKSNIINNYSNHLVINGSYLNNSSVFCYNKFQFKKYKFKCYNENLEEELLEVLRENRNINKQIKRNDNSVKKY